MTDFELTEALGRRGAIVVHFSHHAVMNKARPLYPDDMRKAIAERDSLTLSCCVVWPGHTMDLPGSVGVIFKPTCAAVVSVSNADSGSSVHSDGADQSLGVPLTPESLETTFEVAGGYNEWRLRGAEVEGIFVADPAFIYGKRRIQLDAGGHKFEDVGAVQVSLDDVFDAFPGVAVYTMGPTGKVQLVRPGPQPNSDAM